MFDHVEHLGDAVMNLAQQPARCGHIRAPETQLTGSRAFDTHLLLEVGREDPIPLSCQLPGLKIKMELGDDKQG